MKFLRILRQNQENHENSSFPRKNNENHEMFTIPRQNFESH